MKVKIDTSPLGNASAHRGIGVYTRFLSQALESLGGVELVKNGEDITHYPFFDLFFSTLPILSFSPTVVTVHDVTPLVLKKHYPRGLRGNIKLFRQIFSLRLKSHIITDSISSKNDIMRYLKIPDNKISVVPLAPQPGLSFQSQDMIQKVVKKYKLPKNYILYVGDINYNKNLPSLIKSIKYLPDDIHLVLLGKSFYEQNIPEWQWISTQIALSNVENRVLFINKLLDNSTTDLAAIYSGALAYVQPSLYEGFGLPVLEAMRCKTPVVACDNSSLREVGSKYACYCQADSESISQAVKSILDLNKTDRAKLIDNAYKWSQKFTWKRTAKETVRVYKQVLQ